MKKKSMSRRGVYLFAILLFLSWVALPLFWTGEAAAAPEKKTRLSMGAASTGTWIYMFCALVAEIWQRNIPEVDITVLATAGTTANFIPMDKGELDLAGASTSGDYYAMNGLYFTKQKLSNFCSILPANKAFHQAFTYIDAPYKGWKDLEGKKVNIGARASPTSINTEEIYKALGVKPRYIYSTPNEAIDMVKDRRVDAMIYGTGAPWSGLMDAATAQKIKFIAMTPEEQKKVYSAAPWMVPNTIPAKTYSFQNEDVPTIVTIQTINARPGLPDELVYKLCKVIWERWDEVVKASPASKWVKPADMLSMVSPLHPGAAKYYREVGVPIPENRVWKKK